MTRLLSFALHLVDPRGRCDRRGFLIAALLMLAVQGTAVAALLLTGAAFDGWAAAAANLAFLWIGYAIVSKRLHDLGRSAWWVPAGILLWVLAATGLALAIVLLAGPEVLDPGTPAYWLLFAAMMLPLLAVVVWLHFAAGETTANRYGPVPAAGGFSLPA